MWKNSRTANDRSRDTRHAFVFAFNERSPRDDSAYQGETFARQHEENKSRESVAKREEKRGMLETSIKVMDDTMNMIEKLILFVSMFL